MHVSGFLGDVHPVSYTHLDVYKRQIIYRTVKTADADILINTTTEIFKSKYKSIIS